MIKYKGLNEGIGKMKKTIYGFVMFLLLFVLTSCNFNIGSKENNDVYYNVIARWEGPINFIGENRPVLEGTRYSYSIARYNAEEYEFLGWYDEDTNELLSMDHNYSFIVEKEMNIVLKSKNKYEDNIDLPVKLDIDFDQNQGNVIGQGTYKKYETVEIIANSKEGYSFEGWYLDDKLIWYEKEMNVYLSENITYEARFVEGDRYFEISGKDYYQINDDEYLYFNIQGLGEYKDKSVVNLAVNEYSTSSLNNEGYKQYKYMGLYINNELVTTKNEYSFVVEEDLYFEIKFEEVPFEFDLTYNEEIATITGDRSYSYVQNTNFEIKYLKEDYVFSHWEVIDDFNYNLSFNFYIRENLKLNAVFIESFVEYKYKVEAKEGIEDINIIEGKKVTLFAVVEEGYIFDGWYIGDNLIKTSQSFELKELAYQDVIIEARARLPKYEVELKLSFNEIEGEVFGGGIFLEGSNYTVKAIAKEGYRFLKWYIVDTDQSFLYEEYSNKIYKNTHVIAIFEKIEEDNSISEKELVNNFIYFKNKLEKKEILG